MALHWRRSTTTLASVPTRTHLSSTRRLGSWSPTTCPNTRRVSLAKTHRTIPDRRTPRSPDNRGRRGGPRYKREERFAPPRLSARSRFTKGTFARAHGDVRDAPIPVVRMTIRLGPGVDPKPTLTVVGPV